MSPSSSAFFQAMAGFVRAPPGRPSQVVRRAELEAGADGYPTSVALGHTLTSENIEPWHAGLGGPTRSSARWSIPSSKDVVGL